MRKFVNRKQYFTMKTNHFFKNEALEALRGNWGKAVILTLAYILLAAAITSPTAYSTVKVSQYTQENMGNARSVSQMASFIQSPEYLTLQRRASGTSGTTTLLQIFLLSPIALGFANAFRRLVVAKENNLLYNTIHIGFSNYWHKVWGLLLTSIFIVLWSFLFIIPGIVKAYSYSMTPYILEENPELSASEAIDRSRFMMRGHKFDLFWLQLSFFGWFILSILTFGLGFLWMGPYYYSAKAAFYEEVKADYALNGGLA